MASYSISKYFNLNKDEIIYGIVTTLILGFILSFNDWGVSGFNLAYGLSNLLLTIILVMIALVAKVYTQKYAAIKMGYEAEFKPWILGLILGAVLIFSSNGAFVFLAVGSAVYTVIEKIRIGYKEFPLSYRTMGWISVTGPLINIFLALLFKIFFAIPFVDQQILIKAIGINLWFAVFGILPLPYIESFKTVRSSDGLMLYYASRWGYVWVAALILATAASIWFLSVVQALAFTIVSSIIIWILYYIFYEQKTFS